jgi:NAD(P) transhydrogenase subunit alpha
MPILAIPKETRANEARAAATPDTVKKFAALGLMVRVEQGLGLASGIRDEAYEAAGAVICDTSLNTVTGADIILCVNLPDAGTISIMQEGATLIGMLAPHDSSTDLTPLTVKKMNAFALELLPRISRAQSMDVLSSQSNLAGFRAVIEAAFYTAKTTPMMMTAAGTIAPAKALILGAGVAGLQAIATAKRLGCVVSAFDVRPAVKEQVQSLGAKFIEVAADESGETAGGYAKEMSDDYKKRQVQAIHDVIRTSDIVIATALIPGKPAPELVTKEILQDMKQGAVIVDLAAASGGNCKATVKDQVTEKNGVKLVGYTNLPSRAAADATPLYARNLYNFVSGLMVSKEKELAIQWDDELIQGTLVVKEGTKTK